MQEDPAGTLARVAQIGYNSVEGATYTNTEKFYGMDPKTFHALLKKEGLVMRSCHYRLGEDKNGAAKGKTLNDWDHAVEEAPTLGLKYMGCDLFCPGERQSLGDY